MMTVETAEALILVAMDSVVHWQNCLRGTPRDLPRELLGSLRYFAAFTGSRKKPTASAVSSIADDTENVPSVPQLPR